MTALIERVRSVLAEGGWLKLDMSALADDADLYDAGLSSHDSVNLMLALEEAFGVEFPDALLKRRTFETVRAIAEALGKLEADTVVR
jgi:acyl carrier protein